MNDALVSSRSLPEAPELDPHGPGLVPGPCFSGERATPLEQEGLAVTWVVLDDRAFGWVQWIQKRTEGPVVATQFAPGSDLMVSTRAAGIESIRVEAASGLRPALETASRPTRRDDHSWSSFRLTRPTITPSLTGVHGFEPAVDAEAV
jgi:hypothetical protein